MITFSEPDEDGDVWVRKDGHTVGILFSHLFNGAIKGRINDNWTPEFTSMENAKAFVRLAYS